MAPVQAIDVVDDALVSTEPEKSVDIEQRVPPSPPKAFECDFDQDPTELYRCLQKKDWKATIQRAVDFPAEARTWVNRHEEDGKLRWRLLPLHAAVIYRAPEDVVEALLCAHPKGAESQDDQGMLPLHLAFRNGSAEGVVNLLLVAFPRSIDVKDRKGRIPLVLAQASNSPNRDFFMRALERGPTYYAVAAAATERAAVIAEQRAIFDAKISEIKNQHEDELSTLRANMEQEKTDLSDKIGELEGELAKTQDTSQVLVDHVNSLEAQLASRSDTERFLATKIATLDASLKSTVQAKEELETTLRAENATLLAEKSEFEKLAHELEESYSSTAAKFANAEDGVAKLTEQKNKLTAHFDDKYKALEIEWADTKADCAILEAQLKKQIETEHSLASQVSHLASRLAESSSENSQSHNSYGSRVRALESERDELRVTIKTLTRKLATVAKVLEDMSAAQDRIVQESAAYEEGMAKAALVHAKIVADADLQQATYLKAAKEREEMALLLKRQEEDAEKRDEERKMIFDAIRAQAETMEVSKKERDGLVQGVSQQRQEIEDLMQKELSIIAQNSEDDEAFVRAVVKSVTKSELAAEEVEPEAGEDQEPELAAEVTPGPVDAPEGKPDTPDVEEVMAKPSESAPDDEMRQLAGDRVEAARET